ncbi:MAG: hypothetical protein AAFQ23_15600 [Cyanobacteria bacterium J06623_1]
MSWWCKTVLKDTASHIAGVRCGQVISPVALKDTPTDKVIVEVKHLTENYFPYFPR